MDVIEELSSSSRGQRVGRGRGGRRRGQRSQGRKVTAGRITGQNNQGHDFPDESERGRGRGQVRGGGRGRGRGTRGRGRSRGRGRGLQQDTLQNISTLQEQRLNNIHTLIDEMSEADAKELLKQLSKKMPSIVLDIYDRSNADMGPSSNNDPPKDNLDWCVCTHCVQMPTAEERVCCGHMPQQCVSRLAEMDLYILDPLVLRLQQTLRNDFLGLHAVEVVDVNKSYRHASYRQFILWQFGRLGFGNRRVVPSCCTKRIRDAFPDPQGNYVGFKPSLLGQ